MSALPATVAPYAETDALMVGEPLISSFLICNCWCREDIRVAAAIGDRGGRAGLVPCADARRARRP
jgi:hypothetical protein